MVKFIKQSSRYKMIVLATAVIALIIALFACVMFFRTGPDVDVAREIASIKPETASTKPEDSPIKRDTSNSLYADVSNQKAGVTQQDNAEDSHWIDVNMAYLKDPVNPEKKRGEQLLIWANHADERSIRALMTAAEERMHMSRYAMDALGKVRDEKYANRLRPFFRKHLSSDDASIACSAALAYAESQQAVAVPDLLSALDSNADRVDGYEEMVCTAILEALAGLPNADSEKRIAKELNKSGRNGWTLDYGSLTIRTLKNLQGDPCLTEVQAYRDWLVSTIPEDPIAAALYQEKISEAQDYIIAH